MAQCRFSQNRESSIFRSFWPLPLPGNKEHNPSDLLAVIDVIVTLAYQEEPEMLETWTSTVSEMEAPRRLLMPAALKAVK